MRMETEEVRNPPPRDAQKATTSGGIDLSKVLILYASDRVSFQSSPLMFTSRVRSLLFQLFLKASKHLEKLTFNWVMCFKLIYPHLGHDSWRREFSVDFFDVNV